MAVATKRRRKISVNDQQFLWYVSGNYDGCGDVLHVFTADKQFVVIYEICPFKNEEFLTLLGGTFAGSEIGSGWNRFRCPRFVDSVATPQSVRNLIEWCLNESISRQPVDWRGCLLNS